MPQSEKHLFYPADQSKPKPYISYGIPFHQACAYHASVLGSSRSYLVVSKSISAAPAFKALMSALGSDTIAGIRYGIAPHSPWEDVFELVHEIRSSQADLIITLGGCSITDAVKLARLFIANGVFTIAGVDELFGKIRADEDVEPATIPVINVPTTLSGSEFTCAGGATDMTVGHKKKVTMHSSMYADIVVLDPRLSVSTPSRLWLATGVRAIDHFVEGLYGNVVGLFADTTEAPGGEVIENIEKVIANALGSLLTSLLRTKDDWDDEDSRLQTFLALKECPRAGFNGIGASHGIGHQLGALGVRHGETSCVILPWVLQYNWQHGDEELRRRLGLAVNTFWGEQRVAEMLHAAGLSKHGSNLSDVVRAYIDAFDLPRTLGQLGISNDQLEGLSETALTDWCTQINPVRLDKNKVMEILRNAS